MTDLTRVPNTQFIRKQTIFFTDLQTQGADRLLRFFSLSLDSLVNILSPYSTKSIQEKSRLLIGFVSNHEATIDKKKMYSPNREGKNI